MQKLENARLKLRSYLILVIKLGENAENQYKYFFHFDLNQKYVLKQ
jgi:hypothetical protein